MNIRGTVKRLFKMAGFDVRRIPPVFRPEATGECDASRGTVAVTSFRWAKANESFGYIERDVYTRWELDAENYGIPKDLPEKHKWGLKGFGYSLVMDTVRQLHANGLATMNVLDVGGGGSALCKVLSEEFSDRCSLVDDFGIESGDADTASWYEPHVRESLPAKNPTVHYVVGRLGGGRVPGLDEGSFDFIFSVSTLEHVPMKSMSSVFDHMLDLLSPSGFMVHTIDTRNPRLGEWQIFLANYFRHYGVDPAVFEIETLNEPDEENPPLLESAEVQYILHNTRRGCREGTLVLEVRRGGALAGRRGH